MMRIRIKLLIVFLFPISFCSCVPGGSATIKSKEDLPIKAAMIYGMNYSPFSAPKGDLVLSNEKGIFSFSDTCLNWKNPTATWIAKEGFYPIQIVGDFPKLIQLYPLPLSGNISRYDLEHIQNMYAGKSIFVGKSFGYTSGSTDGGATIDHFPEASQSEADCHISLELRERWKIFSDRYHRMTGYKK